MIIFVKIYYQVFWERYKELTDYERIINVITKGEERIEKKVRMKKALAQKVSNYQKPEIQLKISPSFSKFSKYSAVRLPGGRRLNTAQCGIRAK